MRIACSEADIRTSTLQLLSQEINETTHLKQLSCFQVLICTLQTNWHQRDLFTLGDTYV